MRDSSGHIINSIQRTTDRLLLRDITEDDVTAKYVRWMNDPRVNRYLESRFVTHTAESIRRSVVELSQNSVFAAVIDRATGDHIGNIKLGPVDHHHRTADIGIVIGEERCWGKGFATESIIAMTDHAFEVLGLAKVTASVYAINLASIRAFQKAGFELEGTRCSQFSIGESRTDAVMLGRTP